MSTINFEKCPVCDSKNISLFMESNDYSTSKENYNIFKCNDCTFAFTQDAPDEESIGTYYKSEDYVSHSNTKKGVFFKIYHLVRNFMLKSKRKTIQKNTKLISGKLLDIGSGTGYFINHMKNNGWEVNGIEQDAEARNYGIKEFNLDVFDKNKLFEFKKNSFDVVTMWHVLEHIHRLDDYLKTIKEILKSDGKLIIAVPNYTSFDARHYKKYWAAYDLPIHLWHFSPKSILILFEKYNFKLAKTKGMPFDSFYVSALSEKYKKSSLGLIKGMYFGMLSYINALFNKNKYSSLIYIFENKD